MASCYVRGLCLLHCFTMEPLAIFQLQSLETGHIDDNCCTLPIIAANKILTFMSLPSCYVLGLKQIMIA